MNTAGVLLVAVLAAKQPNVDSSTRAGAWDRSVAREIAGDLAGAENVMVRGWGASTDNYWVALRLAYLALLQARYDEAERRYRALLDRPEAELDTDVVRGHAAALAADKSRGLVEPEIWGIATDYALGIYRYRGWGTYAQLPVRLSDRLVLRAAGRFLSASRSSGRSPWAFSDQGSSWRLDEEYLGVAWNDPSAGVEAIGARSATSNQTALWGGAMRLRVGSQWGAIFEASHLRAGTTKTNTQLVPTVFFWPLPSFGMQAGARVTLDDRGNGVSGMAGGTVLAGPVTFDLQGHAGRERWAFSFAGPTILSFDSATTYGGTLTVAWAATRNLRVAFQAEGARLSDQGAYGSYFSASLGLAYAVRP